MACLCRFLLFLLLLLRLFLLGQDLSPLGVPHLLDLSLLVLGFLSLLQRRLHIPCETDVTNDGCEPLPAENSTENLFWIDEPAFRCALLGSKLVILFPEGLIRKRLVRDRDILEPLFCMGVVTVLVWVVLDREPA